MLSCTAVLKYDSYNYDEIQESGDDAELSNYMVSPMDAFLLRHDTTKMIAEETKNAPATMVRRGRF